MDADSKTTNALEVACAKSSARCTLGRKRALAYAGTRGNPLADGLNARFEGIASSVEDEFPVMACWRTFAISGNDGSCVTLDGTALRLEGESIAKHLACATHVAVMAVTLGMDNERMLARKASEGEVEGLLFDACSSSLAEDGANWCQAQVEEQAADAGMRATGHRFSPGFGDLALDVQPALLSAIGADRALGMRVTDAGMLIPTKSVTALLGLR